jgi:putative ABC transport system permease protein
LLGLGLWRRRGTVGLAVLAVAIGASVASALLHVSGDIGNKVSTELRTLGPNLLVVPATGGELGMGGYLDEVSLSNTLARWKLDFVPILYVLGEANGRRFTVVGANLDAALRLHPAWRIDGGHSSGNTPASLMGARLMARLGVRPGDVVTLRIPDRPDASMNLPVGARLNAGGPDDETWWIPLETAHSLAGTTAGCSLVQVRVDGGVEAATAVAAKIDDTQYGRWRTLVLHALSATEGRLLDRTRRLMALVSIVALIAGGLCAFGTLTDLALERRREIALMKALGASPRDVVRLFLAESVAIGALGGLGGWLIGVIFAEVIGRQVFHSAVALRWDVPLLVLALGMAVAVVAGLGPIRLALAVEPAPVLKGE